MCRCRRLVEVERSSRTWSWWSWLWPWWAELDPFLPLWRWRGSESHVQTLGNGPMARCTAHVAVSRSTRAKGCREAGRYWQWDLECRLKFACCAKACACDIGEAHRWYRCAEDGPTTTGRRALPSHRAVARVQSRVDADRTASSRGSSAGDAGDAVSSRWARAWKTRKKRIWEMGPWSPPKHAP
jgi:hypothetical protein